MSDHERPGGAVRRWLLPDDLVREDGAAPRRTARDWVVDALVFAAAVLLGLTALGFARAGGETSGWRADLDPVFGALACLSLWWRRRFPFGVAVAALPGLALADSTVAAGAVIVLNLVLRVEWRRALPMLAAYLVASGIVAACGVQGRTGWGDAAATLAYYLLLAGWGSAWRARRQLVVRLRDDARRERAEHARRLADTRRAEREAIAREMHDVLAHRISLLSVHAGALAYRSHRAEEGGAPALATAEVAESAQVIRDNAHQALEELREVLQVLRGGGAEAAADEVAPQPRLADVPALAEEARRAGQRVELDGLPAGGPEPGDRLQRTAYRVVQEGLTNARKHAPGARVSVRLSGGPGAGLAIEVTNPLRGAGGDVPGAGAGVPGAGAGLIGLRERVELDGGRLEHGARDGVFTLLARLPWPA